MPNLRLGVDVRGSALLATLLNALNDLIGVRADGVMKDDDAAATNGTDVNIVPYSDGSPGGFLSSATAGLADAEYHIGAAGPIVNVIHAGTPGGVALHFNETKRRFEAVVAANKNTYFTAEDGTRVVVYDNDAAATDGVIVHFDDNAVDEELRLLFVSPSNVDGSFAASAITADLKEPTVRAEVRQLEDQSTQVHLEAL